MKDGYGDRDYNILSYIDPDCEEIPPCRIHRGDETIADKDNDIISQIEIIQKYWIISIQDSKNDGSMEK